MPMQLQINGRQYEVDVPSLKPLARVLREDLGLMGTKIGCYEGRCGSCNVLVDGLVVASCLFPLGLAEGAAIRTVEGLGGEGALAPLQEAILSHGGVQCGICTPGILMTLTALLERSPSPAEQEVREALVGNLCRCTGYHKIVGAVLAVAAGRPA
jgi:aerobic carbon-monoxide dehydrogenase small subunit